MASKLILNNAKAPINFLLRNPATSVPLTQTILRSLIPPIPIQPAVESSKLFDRTAPSSTDLMPGFDDGVRIEDREKRPERFEDVDEMVESGSDDVEDSDEFGSDYEGESGGDFYDDDDVEPRDDKA